MLNESKKRYKCRLHREHPQKQLERHSSQNIGFPKPQPLMLRYIYIYIYIYIRCIHCWENVPTRNRQQDYFHLDEPVFAPI
jgi:hypothetical protein